jgi:hypothetical protein
MDVLYYGLAFRACIKAVLILLQPVHPTIALENDMVFPIITGTYGRDLQAFNP